jgi:hypothetical protein
MTHYTRIFRRHPEMAREISVFLLTFLIMDVPGIPACVGVPNMKTLIMMGDWCSKD